jgi:hypothetical protein
MWSVYCRSAHRASRIGGGRRLRVATVAASLGIVLWSPPRVSAQVIAGPPPEAPETYLGFRVGTDRRLADWDQICGYLSQLAKASERVRLDTLGRSTLDRPLVLLTVSDPANMERLEEYRAIQAQLADPRLIADPVHRRELISRGRLVILITAAIHANEVGGSQLALRLAYRLATSQEPDVRRALREAIILLVPSLNPDGVQAVTEWYRSTVDMPWEGAAPPFLDHHYAGHDNNRDWYALTQQETQVVVARVHNVWHPQIVHDIHQQSARGSRFFVPPWIDPIDPNVDPLLITATNALGTSIAWQMHLAGRTGVVVNTTYDSWSPSRAYAHYHGGVRLLSETASARLATPVDIAVSELQPIPGALSDGTSWNLPAPWQGGPWSLADIVGYMEDGVMALLRTVAGERERWLETFTSVGERAIQGWERWPSAWVIPARQRNEAGVAELLRILLSGGVEVERAVGPVGVAGREFKDGSYVVRMHQPYAAFAQTLLETQLYPEILEADGGSPRKPYDVTAHTLPLLLDVDAVAVWGRVRAETRPVEEPPAVELRVQGLSDSPSVLVGLYQPYVPSIDEGWTRWIFDRYAIPYAAIHNEEILQGDLARRFTAIVLPSASPAALREGWADGSLPQRYVGGLGKRGAAALREFAEAGGTLVALNRASTFILEELDLPLRDRLEGLGPREFFAPGAIVSLAVDTSSYLAAGMPPQTAAWIEGGLAFEPDAGAAVSVVARYGSGPTLMSGWIVAERQLAGRAAMIRVNLGRGAVVLFGFRPQYRGQSLATFPLLFNALRPAEVP